MRGEFGLRFYCSVVVGHLEPVYVADEFEGLLELFLGSSQLLISRLSSRRCLFVMASSRDRRGRFCSDRYSCVRGSVKGRG